MYHYFTSESHAFKRENETEIETENDREPVPNTNTAVIVFFRTFIVMAKFSKQYFDRWHFFRFFSLLVLVLQFTGDFATLLVDSAIVIPSW
jgi:hypothetical protein